MRTLVIIVAVSVLLELSSSALRDPIIKNDKRNSRQSFYGPSPLNPFYSPLFNRSYNTGYVPSTAGTQFARFNFQPQTLQYSAHDSVTVIPNAEPRQPSYQTQQAHSNSNSNAQSQATSRAQAQLNSQQQQQYQQLLQTAQNVPTLQPLQSTAQPIYFSQSDPLSFQSFYSTPAPSLFPSLFDIPMQQLPSLIDQGFYKYPVYVDPTLMNTIAAPPKAMFMKKRTLQDLCAAYAPEEKTVIYVLSQNPREPLEEIEVPKTPIPTKPSKPEVFFVKYNTAEEAELAQKHIQAQYDALGGTSELSNEGVSPITTAQEILNNAHNLTRKIDLNQFRRH